MISVFNWKVEAFVKADFFVHHKRSILTARKRKASKQEDK
jgi:hypothetical protein